MNGIHRIENKDGTVLVLRNGEQLKFTQEFLNNILKPTEDEEALWRLLVMHNEWQYHRARKPSKVLCPHCGEVISGFLDDNSFGGQEPLEHLCPFCLEKIIIDFQIMPIPRKPVESDIKPQDVKCEPKYEDA
jgi:hypothetical protein